VDKQSLQSLAACLIRSTSSGVQAPVYRLPSLCERLALLWLLLLLDMDIIDIDVGGGERAEEALWGGAMLLDACNDGRVPAACTAALPVQVSVSGSAEACAE
jgi:hypothetical protein